MGSDEGLKPFTKRISAIIDGLDQKSAAASPRPRGRPRRAPGQPVHRKPCEQISYNDASAFVRAIHFAVEIGQEPNVHFTIQWRHAPSHRPIPQRITRIINLIGQWLKRRTGKSAVWLFAREVGKLKGEHLHLVVHVPPALRSDLAQNIHHWLELEASGDVRETAVRAVPIKPGAMRHELRSYLLKDGTAKVRALWVNDHHKATGGVVQGKRTRIAHAIGPAAQRESQRIEHAEAA